MLEISYYNNIGQISNDSGASNIAQWHSMIAWPVAKVTEKCSV